MEETATYEYEYIADIKQVRQQVMVNIKWKDFASKYNTWEPITNISDPSEVVILLQALRKKVATKRGVDQLKKLELIDQVIGEYEAELAHSSQNNAEFFLEQLPEQKGTPDFSVNCMNMENKLDAQLSNQSALQGRNSTNQPSPSRVGSASFSLGKEPNLKPSKGRQPNQSDDHSMESKNVALDQKHVPVEDSATGPQEPKPKKGQQLRQLLVTSFVRQDTIDINFKDMDESSIVSEQPNKSSKKKNKIDSANQAKTRPGTPNRGPQKGLNSFFNFFDKNLKQTKPSVPPEIPPTNPQTRSDPSELEKIQAKPKPLKDKSPEKGKKVSDEAKRPSNSSREILASKPKTPSKLNSKLPIQATLESVNQKLGITNLHVPPTTNTVDITVALPNDSRGKSSDPRRQPIYQKPTYIEPSFVPRPKDIKNLGSKSNGRLTPSREFSVGRTKTSKPSPNRSDPAISKSLTKSLSKFNLPIENPPGLLNFRGITEKKKLDFDLPQNPNLKQKSSKPSGHTTPQNQKSRRTSGKATPKQSNNLEVLSTKNPREDTEMESVGSTTNRVKIAQLESKNSAETQDNGPKPVLRYNRIREDTPEPQNKPPTPNRKQTAISPETTDKKEFKQVQQQLFTQGKQNIQNFHRIPQAPQHMRQPASPGAFKIQPPPPPPPLNSGRHQNSNHQYHPRPGIGLNPKGKQSKLLISIYQNFMQLVEKSNSQYSRFLLERLEKTRPTLMIIDGSLKFIFPRLSEEDGPVFADIVEMMTVSPVFVMDSLVHFNEELSSLLQQYHAATEVILQQANRAAL